MVVMESHMSGVRGDRFPHGKRGHGGDEKKNPSYLLV